MAVSVLRVVVLSGADVRDLVQLLHRIRREASGVEICGVLYQLPRPPKPFHRRIVKFLGNLPDRQYFSYVVARSLESVVRRLARAGHGLLRLAHACPDLADAAKRRPRDELVSVCKSIGCELYVAADIHSMEAMAFVRNLHADLGVVWGTRLLKPDLFNIPRLGSVNIHRKKVPEYRGSGPTGLWELLDRQREVGITIHRVEAALDAGAVLDCGTVPIEPFDTLASLDRKVHVAGNDLLVRSLIRCAAGEWQSTAQSGRAREFRRPQPHLLRRYQKQIAAGRLRYEARPAHNLPTLLLRTLWCAPYVLVRNWLRRIRGSFPIVILRHDLGTDSPGSRGIPLDLLLKHLDFLRKHYRIVSLDQATALLARGRIAMPTVVLTFEGETRASLLNLRAALGSTEDKAALFVSAHHLIDVGKAGADSRHEPAGGSLTWNDVAHLGDQGIDIGARVHARCQSAMAGRRGHANIVSSKIEFERRLGRTVRHVCLSDESVGARLTSRARDGAASIPIRPF